MSSWREDWIQSQSEAVFNESGNYPIQQIATQLQAWICVHLNEPNVEG